MTSLPTVKPSAVSRPAFLAAVAASGIGPTARELVELLDDLPPHSPVAVAAHQLVVRGALTRFQADHLLAGKTAGLALGPYLLLEPVGEEDGGRLFRARHRVMDRLVGVWVSAADNPGRAARLTAAHDAARLAHPHVLTVLDVHPHAARPYVVTEYVDGAGLDEVVRLAGRLPVGRACDLLRQVALGLAHAHERGVGHGRLTAESVRVGRPGGGGPEGRMVVKLAGFAGGPADGRTVCTDLLAFGRLAAHLFAGKPNVPVPAGLPPAVAGLVADLLNANPYRRPAAALVAERLAPFADAGAESPADITCPFADMVGDQPTDACAVTRAVEIGRRPRLAAVGVVVAVGLFTAALVAAML